MKKRILCFGDSNTWGYAPDGSGRYDENTRWTGILQKELGTEYQVIEEGHNGRTTVFDDPIENRMSGLKYFYPCVASQAPLDLIIIMLGSNDLKTRFGMAPGTIASTMKQYVNTLKVVPLAGSQPEVLVVAPIAMGPSYKNDIGLLDGFGPDAVERSLGFADGFKRVAEELGVHYMNAAAYAQPSHVDGLHMEAEEHEKLGMAFAEKVREIFENIK